MDASVTDLYNVTPRQLAECVVDDFYAGLVPYVEGEPGIGKSSIFAQVAKKLRLKLIDVRLSTCAPEDLSGLPMIDPVTGMAVFKPFAELFPTEDTPIPEGYDGWLIFLDELNAAPRSVIAAGYKLILDKMVGQKKLHPAVVMAAAGNKSTDNAITNPMGTAMQSRLVHYTLKIDFKEWLEDVALPNGYDYRLIGYLNRFESKLHDFKPDHSNRTFCCPRTWEFFNETLKLEPNKKAIPHNRTHRYIGKITPGVAVDFISFTQVFENLVTEAQIMADPTGLEVPYDPSVAWGTCAFMAENAKLENFDSFCTYISRFDLDKRILFFRSVLLYKVDLREHPSFARALIEMDEYLQ